jgi:Mg-chelatase subunit ChlD
MRIKEEIKINTNLEIKTINEFSECLSSKETEILVLTSIKAPEFTKEEEKDEKRAPIDIVCVIDKSGSMRGEKMELVKSTLKFMLEQLGPEDRVALVAFDSDVDSVFGFLNMDEKGKDNATKSINCLKPGSATNLSGGLFKGYELVKERENPSEICSILLFTDGLANNGITKT